MDLNPFRSDDRVAVFAALSTSLLSFLQGLDSTTIAGFTAMQGFLKDFGYFDSVTETWKIDPDIQLVITFLIPLGAALGSVVAGPFSAAYGQRIGMIACSITSITGTIIQTSSTSLAVGMATNFILVYQAEVSPKKLRGLILASFGLMVAFGGFIGTCINQGTHMLDSRWSYRIPLMTQLICPLAFLCIVLILPESLRFLVSRDRVEEAYKAFARLHGDSTQAQEHRQREMVEIILFVNLEKERQRSTTYLDCFRGTDRRRTLIAIGLMTAQNFAGRDFLGNYGTYFFWVAGIKNPFPISVVLNLSGLLACAIAFPLVRSYGRRPIVLSGTAIFTISLSIFASVGEAMPGSVIASKILIAFMVFYNVGFQLAMVVMASMMVSESASSRLRSQAQSITVFTAWAEAVMWSAVLPYLINPDAANLGAKIEFMFGAFGILAFVFVSLCVPEYKNRSLEELDEMFMKRVPARRFSSFVCEGTVDGHGLREDKVGGSVTMVEDADKRAV